MSEEGGEQGGRGAREGRKLQGSVTAESTGQCSMYSQPFHNAALGLEAIKSRTAVLFNIVLSIDVV